MPQSSRWTGRVALTVTALCLAASPPLAAQTLTIAAAASLHGAYRELAAGFTDTTGVRTTLVFGASGSLAHQIENGAPYDLFASADTRWVQTLIDQGHLQPDSLLYYAEGVLALATRIPGGMAGSTTSPESVPLDAKPLDGWALRKALAPVMRVIAMAHPGRAPYGTAAREALQAADLWNSLQARLVFGDNVRQTLTYLETGNVEAAFVAASLLVGDGKGISWRPVSGSLHQPIRQSLGIATATALLTEARRFARFLTSPAGHAILERYGFRIASSSRSIQ